MERKTDGTGYFFLSLLGLIGVIFLDYQVDVLRNKLDDAEKRASTCSQHGQDTTLECSEDGKEWKPCDLKPYIRFRVPSSR